MSHVRFVGELIALALAVFFVAMGFYSQAALGVGLIAASFVIPAFVIELFLHQRSAKKREEQDYDLDVYLKKRLGFDYHDKILLEVNNISEDDIVFITEWHQAHSEEKALWTKFWRKEFLDRIAPIGMDWASGYTPNLDKFSHDVKEEEFHLDEHFFFSGYKREIELTERILAQNGRNNVLIVGEEGVGKQFVLKGLERLIETGRTLPALSYKRFVWLDVDAVLSGIQNQGDLRERLAAVFGEVTYAGNIVLGIERIHSFFDPAFPEIADIMIPFLQSDRSQVAATTTPQLLTSRLNRQDVLTQFARVTLEEPSMRNTVIALEEIALDIEHSQGVFIPYQTIKKIIEFADRFSVDSPRPQKDINLLQEVVSFAKSAGRGRVDVPDVVAALSQRTGIPLGALSEDEKQKLLHIEDVLHKKLIDQAQAVSAIAKALKRSRLEVRQPARPIGSFLFLGPTGVGKTTAAKALAQLYFGRDDGMVRFDMSEYQKLQDITRLIDTLSAQMRQHPYSLLLLDEFEKADKKILNLFLQILDEGIMTDTQGIKVDFRNIIIIATSNAGSEFIRTNFEQVGSEVFERQLLDRVQEAGFFSPELLNRFDAVVTFKPLGEIELQAIAQLLLQELAAQLKAQQNITLTITPELAAFLAKKGFHPEYGARPMRRVLQDTVETYIADKLLAGSLKKGDTLTVSPPELQSYAK